MIIPINNNFTPIPFYVVSGNELDNKYLQSNKPYAYGAVFDMPVSEGWLMPFQFTLDSLWDAVDSFQIVTVADTPSTIALVAADIGLRNDREDTTTVYYKGEHKATLPLGRMYYKLVLRETKTSATVTLMSDIFTNVKASQNNQHSVPNGYIRLTYSNDHTLKYGGGQINFSNITGGFDFELLINATICKPEYNFEEKASERLGQRYIESQVSTKTYSFSFTAPEYLCDALRILPMCNNRIIKDEWNSYNKITDVNVNIEWLEQGDLAKVTITFKNDTVMANLAEYESVVPKRLSTNLPIPDPPLIVLPEVALNTIADIHQTYFGAVAEVLSDGNGTLTERGLCWSASGTPTIASSHLASPTTEIGVFRMTLPSGTLTANTTYYVRAYAINEEAGIAYSNVMTVTTMTADAAPTVKTVQTNNYGDVYAFLTGTVESEGSQPLTARGFEIWEYTDPSTVVAIAVSQRGYDYVEQVTGLTPNTQYAYRAYATNPVGTSYGDTLTFTTKNTVAKPPTVVTDTNPRDVTASSVTLGGTVASNGGAEVTERGIVYIQGHQTPSIGSGIKVVDDNPNLGTFYLNIQNLLAGQTYSYRAYAKNYAGTSYGETGTFTTVGTAGVPIVQMEKSGVDVNRLILVGSVVSDEGSAITEVGFFYSLNSDMSNAQRVVGTLSGKVFTKEVTGLTANTTYYVQAYGSNSVGMGYSSIVSYTTYPTPSSVPTVTVDQINPSTAARDVVFTAEVTDDGGLTVAERGICWSFLNTPTISDNVLTDESTGVGEYEVSVAMNKINYNRRVYYRAYAINSLGVGYSDIKFFWDDNIDLTPVEEENER